MEKEPIKNHKDLKVYQMAFDAAMKIFEFSKKFPVEERYSLTYQIRRSDARRLANASLSRSVCANLAEAWRKRRYEAAFVAKLNDCVREACRRQAEAVETQTWIEFAVKCNYLDVELGRELYGIYNRILGGLVNMITDPSPWLMKR
ncbi:four helix bundle protein [Nostoc sp. ChiVER01]|uniref:four helix bundle protein n=1 Tax=Nostoc sp. ChiVER01 TaxID=3075382 RepID=UPI002AD53CAC|nr:four helix bundle protein [Nostoc sp. ChiVER01]MDZ8227512.1 four helix bundle protein [Nostoc sp. ChiVER01]